MNKGGIGLGTVIFFALFGVWAFRQHRNNEEAEQRAKQDRAEEIASLPARLDAGPTPAEHYALHNLMQGRAVMLVQSQELGTNPVAADDPPLTLQFDSRRCSEAALRKALAEEVTTIVIRDAGFKKLRCYGKPDGVATVDVR